jgi:hypothetical protein
MLKGSPPIVDVFAVVIVAVLNALVSTDVIVVSIHVAEPSVPPISVMTGSKKGPNSNEHNDM